MKRHAVSCLEVCLLQLFIIAALAGLARARVDFQPVTVPVTAAPMATVFDVNLRNGVSSSLPAGVTWQSNLTANQVAGTCDRQGVLKLTLSHWRKRAEINMTFDYSVDWTFNVGDSVTNNGYGGDNGFQDNDAEVHSKGNAIYFYGRDRPSGGSYGLIHIRANFVGVAPHLSLTLNIADQLATAYNGDRSIYISTYKLFALNGQGDSSPGGVNRDVYLGMNRVVGTAWRKGSGLCRVRVKFYSS